MYILAWTIPYMPYIEYELNKKYIAEVLCENKDKPEMHCNGKCHLKKQIKKANSAPVQQQQEPQAPPPLKSDPVITVLFLSKQQSFYAQKCRKIIVPYLINYQFILITDIFHPPKA